MDALRDDDLEWLILDSTAGSSNARRTSTCNRARGIVEWFRSKIKKYRRVATRDDKKAQNFLAFVQVASIMVILR